MVAILAFNKGASSFLANFLHLSKTNVERICELILHEEPLNPNQCQCISSMLEKTMQSIELFGELLTCV
jgi:hypothetical protein